MSNVSRNELPRLLVRLALLCVLAPPLLLPMQSCATATPRATSDSPIAMKVYIKRWDTATYFPITRKGIEKSADIALWLAESYPLAERVHGMFAHAPSSGALDELFIRLKVEFPLEGVIWYVDASGEAVSSQNTHAHVTPAQQETLWAEVSRLAGVIDIRKVRQLLEEGAMLQEEKKSPPRESMSVK